MSVAQVERVATLASEKDRKAHQNKKPKHFFKHHRKRSQSFTGANMLGLNVFKRRKHEMTLPTKFLLGGNICDPLNLNSLEDEEINRVMNAVTPKSSPLPTPPRKKAPIEVKIPPNINDPLNLTNYTDDETYEKQLTTLSPVKRSRKKNNRKRNKNQANQNHETDASLDANKSGDASNVSESDHGVEKRVSEGQDVKITRQCSESNDDSLKLKRKAPDEGTKDVKKLRRDNILNKIVSPVIPQPGTSWKRKDPALKLGGAIKPLRAKQVEKTPTFNEKNKQYQYGNYNRYYGYRNPNHEEDARLRIFSAYRGIFQSKDVLDIGCNIGHITLSLARDYQCRSVVGLDIDRKLVKIAKKNICHYMNTANAVTRVADVKKRHGRRKKCKKDLFPISMPLVYGPLDVPGQTDDATTAKGFPYNVTFVHGNYVVEDDSMVQMDEPQFDVILALSITKWIHLNWGDAGLKRVFRRMYYQLRPGGRLILEPQAWKSYVKNKSLTETTYKNYKSIEFFPQQFNAFLLSSEIGFAKSEVIGCPSNKSKGFQRPIFMFTKSNLSPLDFTPSYKTAAEAILHQKRVYACAEGNTPSPNILLEKHKSPDHDKLNDVATVITTKSPNRAETLEIDKLPAQSTSEISEHATSDVELLNCDDQRTENVDTCADEGE